ncbi:tryptophan--tRNA ligase [Saprospiraceae bacterium]|nr:tryptophan--tRNA ligase [Saprospiraceae bacterium]
MENVKSKCDVLSCIQPTGDVTLGNYFGAIQNWVELQENNQCIYGIVDLHTMTKGLDAKSLRHYTDQMIVDLLACGIDPSKSTLFVQSLVPEHTELSWILSTFASYGELSRQIQFKTHHQNNESTNVGLFSYPILQAADILIYKAKRVPVGIDQKQHLELTRSIANKFNNKYGELFPIPEMELTETPKIMSLTNPSMKMSKSAGEKHFVRLFEEEAILREKIKSAVTDTVVKEGEMSEGVESLFNLLKASGAQDEYKSLIGDFEKGNLKYSNLKEALADSLVNLTGELRYKRAQIQGDISLIHDTIRDMSAKARQLAQETLFEVKQCTGVKSISNF